MVPAMLAAGSANPLQWFEGGSTGLEVGRSVVAKRWGLDGDA